MTTPSRINEILHEMEQDPDLAQALRDRVLGQEISMLPAAVAQNQGLIIRLMERQVELASAVNSALDAVVSAMSQAGENTARALEAHGRRIEGLESAMAELREESQRTRELLSQVLTDVEQLQAGMTQARGDIKQLQTTSDELRSDVKNLQGDVKGLQVDVKGLQGDVKGLQVDVKGLQGDVKSVQGDVKGLQGDVKGLQGDVRRIDGRLDRGFGANYEAKVSQNVRSILGQQAGVRNARVLKGPNLRNDPDLDLQVENAEATGAITENESDELLLLDLIISGTLAGTLDRVYVGIEASITANDDDVNRAADRAEMLRKVTGSPVMAAVIAARVEAPQRELAARREVTVAVHSE